MDRKVCTTWAVSDMEQLEKAVFEVVEIASRRGHHPAVVYPNVGKVELIEGALTDGSTVMDVRFSPPVPVQAAKDAGLIAKAVMAAVKEMPPPSAFFGPSKEGKSVLRPAKTPVDRLMDCLEFWDHGNADVIHMGALAEDDGPATVGDLIKAAVAFHKGGKA